MKFKDYYFPNKRAWVSMPVLLPYIIWLLLVQATEIILIFICNECDRAADYINDYLYGNHPKPIAKLLEWIEAGKCHNSDK